MIIAIYGNNCSYFLNKAKKYYSLVSLLYGVHITLIYYFLNKLYSMHNHDVAITSGLYEIRTVLLEPNSTFLINSYCMGWLLSNTILEINHYVSDKSLRQ